MKVRKYLKKVLVPILILSMVLVSVTGFSGSKDTPVYEFEEDEDGKPDGWGVCEYPDGTVYEGEMSHGYFEGLGLCLDPNGEEGEVIRAAYFNQSENPDTYNYAIEYYPDSGRVVFGQNEYDALDERWTVTMGEDPSIYCTVRCFTAGKRRRSEEIERVRFDYYYDGHYEVGFTDENGKQIDNNEITTYYSGGGIEIGYDDEEGIGLWFEDYGDLIKLGSTLNGYFSCSGVIIGDGSIDIGSLDRGSLNGIGIEYYNQAYFILDSYVNEIPDGVALRCQFSDEVYSWQEYELGELVNRVWLEFPQGVSANANQEETDTTRFGRSGKGNADTSDETVSGRMWIVGEGESYLDPNAEVSQDASSYAEQIDKIMESFEAYNAENTSTERHAPNGSYRMFELLCVIAKELDSSGTYADAVAESALNRYKETDAGVEYGHMQIINGLYRCEEMLASIMYEIGGEGSVAEIEEIFAAGPYADATEDSFLDCEGDAAAAVYRYLYEIISMLDLPDSNREKIQADYELWLSDMQVVENERNKMIYSPGMRRHTGSLYRIYELLDQTAMGLDAAGSYSVDIHNIEETVEEAKEVWKGGIEDTIRLEIYYYAWDGSLYDACTNLLSIIARLLDPDAF